MGDWDKIAQWNAAAVRSISNDLNAQLNKLKGTEAELRAAATPKVWDGEGAEAAKKSLDGIERGVLHRVEEFASLRAATDDAADRIERLHEAMDATEHLARTNDFQIVDGAVVPRSDARAAEPGQGAATTNPEVKAALEAQVEQIVRAGMDIDADLTTVILSISDGKGWSDASTMAAAAKAGAASG